MSATVTYKGETLTTATNQTRVLETEGTYLEDDITITDVTGAAPSGTKNISITTNGTTTEDVTSYATASITTAVPASAVDSGTKSISISSNGTTTHDVVGYASASITTNVPNSYSASDEGKVVSNGALVSQTAHADVTPTTSDQTIDTTTNNSIKVKGDADLVAGNIKKDVEIFGVTGSYEGGGGSLGGLANMVDVNSSDYQLAYMLMCMKKGDTVGGTVTYTTAFSNSEQKILETGLTTLHGVLFVGTSQNLGSNTGYTQCQKWILIVFNSNNTFEAIGTQSSTTTRTNLRQEINSAQSTTYAEVPINGSIRKSGGDLYYTARYNKNASYQILAANAQYEWLAW